MVWTLLNQSGIGLQPQKSPGHFLGYTGKLETGTCHEETVPGIEMKQVKASSYINCIIVEPRLDQSK